MAFSCYRTVWLLPIAFAAAFAIFHLGDG